MWTHDRTGAHPARRSPSAWLRVLYLLLALSVVLAGREAGAGNYTVCTDQDTWLKESSPNENRGTDVELSSKSSSGDDMRALLRFDLSPIPSGARVSTATASLWVTGKDDSGSPVNVHRVTANWNENSAKWRNAANDYDATVEGSFSPTVDDTFATVDLGALVQDWIDGTHSNHGIMLISTSSGTEAKFASEEWDTASQRPCIEVVTEESGAGPITAEVCTDQDTWLKESSPNEKHGTDVELSSKSSGGDDMRPMFRFDISSIPGSATILDASASFWVTGKDDSGSPVNVHRVTGNWNENSAKWRNAANDYDPTIRGSFSPTVDDAFATVDLRSLVQDWIDGTHSNHGIMLISTSSGTEAKFASEEWDTASQRPCMEVTYTTGGATDHFEVSHDGAALNCQAENLTISAHDASDQVLASYGGTIVLSTTTSRGDWSLVNGSGTLVNSGGGEASYAFDVADNGQVTLGLLDTYSEVTNIDVTNGSAREAASEDPDLVFSSTGFVFLANGVANAIGTQIGGKPSHIAPGAQSLEIQAVRTSDATGACEGALAGATPIRLAFECEDPTRCTTRRASINGTPIQGNDAASALGYTNVSLDFGDASDSTAAFTLTYPDVGRIRLHALHTLSPSGEEILGASNRFVVRPFAFDLSIPGNPAASDPDDGVFTSAGAAFEVAARAVLWSAADDVNGDGVADGHDDADPTDNADLTDNALALNYGVETNPETLQLAATLVAPSGGNHPGLQGGVTISGFGSGTGITTTARYDEVGVIEVVAAIRDGSYLDIGPAETSAIVGRSGRVGRFTPNRFEVTANAPEWGTGCPLGAFSWAGQPLQYVSAKAPMLDVRAVSLAGGTTENYSGDWFRLSHDALGDRHYAINEDSLDLSGLPGPDVDPVVTAGSAGHGTVLFASGSGIATDRGAPRAPFDAEIELSIDIVDLDGVAYAANPFRIGGTSPGSGIAFDVSKRIQFGRLRFENAFGSEYVDLPMRLVAQHFDGAVFIDDDNDSCSLVREADLVMTPSPGSLVATPTVANQPLLTGDSGLELAAPNAIGSIEIVVDLGPGGANLPWLRFDWPRDGNLDGNLDDDPAAQATFGIWPGRKALIYQREVY